MSFSNKRAHKHTYKEGSSIILLEFEKQTKINKRKSHNAVNLCIFQEEGEREKVMALKFGIEIRNRVRKPWISKKKVFRVWSVSEKMDTLSPGCRTEFRGYQVLGSREFIKNGKALLRVRDN